MVLCEIAGVIGSIFTTHSIPGWYAGLRGDSQPSGSPEKSVLDWRTALVPAALVLVVTVALSLFAGRSESMLLARSGSWSVVRFFAITATLLLPLPILPLIITSLGLARDWLHIPLVREKAKVEFSRVVLWGIRPLQGVGMSLLFVNQLLNLFRSYPELSFVSALIRPLPFVAISIPFSVMFTVLWSLDDLGVKVYLKDTGEVRLIGGYVGKTLPIISGAVGTYSLYEHGASATDALIMLTLVGMVLYAPYVMFAYIHHRYVSQREAQLLERLKPECVDVHLVDDHAGFTLFTCNHLVAQSRK